MKMYATCVQLVNQPTSCTYFTLKFSVQEIYITIKTNYNQETAETQNFIFRIKKKAPSLTPYIIQNLCLSDLLRFR